MFWEHINVISNSSCVCFCILVCCLPSFFLFVRVLRLVLGGRYAGENPEKRELLMQILSLFSNMVSSSKIARMEEPLPSAKVRSLVGVYIFPAYF
jgi:hypothetical protein